MRSYQKSKPSAKLSGEGVKGGGGFYFENFGGTLSEEFSDYGTRVTEMTVIDFEGFKISFTEIVDSGTVHGIADFVGIFK